MAEPKNEFALHASAALVENKEIISPAFIEIKDGKITGIGNSNSKKNLRCVQLENIFLLPGFVNAHCHLEFSHFGPLPEHEFVPWIKKLMTHDQKAGKDDIQKNILRLMESGVTTIFDHVSPFAPPEYFNNSPARIIRFGEVVGAAQNTSSTHYDLQKIIKANSPFPFYITPHGIHSVHRETLKKIFKDEKDHFSVHLCESKEEDEFFKKNSGAMTDLVKERPNSSSAIQFIQEHFGELKNSLVIHANFIDDEDLNIIKSWKNICVVHCPGSFDFFAHNNFPYEKIRRQGIPIALGTDSHASNPDFNFLTEVKLFLKKFPQKNIFELIPQLTTNACTAIGLKNVGQIKVGYHADIVGFKVEKNFDGLETLKSKNMMDFSLVQGKSCTLLTNKNT